MLCDEICYNRMTDEPINEKVTVSSPETGVASTKQTSKFEDLTSAGRVLATRLEDYSGTNTVVLAIARGGVPVALEVARHLAAPLDIILIRRLLANGPSSQICAVNVGGNLIIDQGLALPSDSPNSPFEYFMIDALGGLAQRERSCRGSRPALEVERKNVLVIDNGIHTGSTVLAVIRALRKMNPSSLIVGVPVAALSTRRNVESAADELVCLKWPEPFGHVGLWYTKFVVPNEEQIRDVLDRVSLP
jgi:putative phosphoribosyl transferase